MAIRLLALDLDGTLLNSRGELSERNLWAIRAAREKGVRVALVTGRRFRDARPLALELGLDVPVISHNGALTKHARTLETVAVKLLPLEAARAVLSLGRASGADALVSDAAEGPGVLVYDHMSDNNPALAKYVAWARRIHGEEAEEAVRRVPLLEDYLDHAPVHVSFSGGVERMKRFEEKLVGKLGARVKVLSTIYPKLDFTLLDVLHPEVSKGVGVEAAARELGLSREEVMAAGDNFNDLEMLQYAGTGVLMGNAEASLRALVANLPHYHPTATNDEDGVALAIEKFILGQNSEARSQKPE
ncbi:MAG TPA: Cof-type HAD-IIB family hydrolase [Pyrinomonadaceae bacterium]|jgi:Cof subfamily protein (haloacid dehalogenase superfamily)